MLSTETLRLEPKTMSTPSKQTGDPATSRESATVPVSVSVRHLYKTFDTTAVLKDVSLDIRRGEFFSLLGPSGCGKTTLLRSIGGFETPTSGEVHIDGKNMEAIPPFGRPTNMIFQQLALFPHLTVFENVAFGLRVQKYPKAKIGAKVDAALALVRLDGFEKRTLGNTFIFVTHDQGEAMSMSDRIAVMNAGIIVQLGTPEEIYEQPATRFVAQFVGHTNLFDGKVVKADGARVVVDSDGLRLTAATAMPLETGQPVTVVLRYERVGLEPGDTALTAQVVERMYLGGMVRVIVELENHRRVTADIASTAAADLPAIGSPVTLSFAARDARVLVA
jgi:spermidine/putrescine transport system ATP-binding protein